MKSHVLAASAMIAALSAFGLAAQAQQIFRSIGPDGRVTFSDKPAAADSQASGTANASAGPQLPFELRQAVTRFPVTLYTGNACSPCATGRTLLTTRGVPFNERIVSSPEDIDALQRLSGEIELPLLTVGNQQIKGYSESEWGQFLNAAGYPRTSQLPASYRNPPPQPLAPKPAAPAAAENRPQAPTQFPVQVPPSNPAGIRF